jgi:hypothetical protein
MPHLKSDATSQAERIVRCAWRLFHGGEVTSIYIRERFGVSKATAKRDMQLLELVLPVRDGTLMQVRAQKRISVPRPVQHVDDEVLR